MYKFQETVVSEFQNDYPLFLSSQIQIPPNSSVLKYSSDCPQLPQLTNHFRILSFIFSFSTHSFLTNNSCLSSLCCPPVGYFFSIPRPLVFPFFPIFPFTWGHEKWMHVKKSMHVPPDAMTYYPRTRLSVCVSFSIEYISSLDSH